MVKYKTSIHSELLTKCYSNWKIISAASLDICCSYGKFASTIETIFKNFNDGSQLNNVQIIAFPTIHIRFRSFPIIQIHWTWSESEIGECTLNDSSFQDGFGLKAIVLYWERSILALFSIFNKILNSWMPNYVICIRLFE